MATVPSGHHHRRLTQTLSYASSTNRYTCPGGSSCLDADGNLLIDVLNSARTFTYDERNRLSSFNLSGTLQRTYSYNGMGQRLLRKRYNPFILENYVYYHYNQSGALLGDEHYSSSNSTPYERRGYVWVGGMPLAQVVVTSSATTWSYLHPDNLATPRLASNSSGTIVWRWDPQAFGDNLPNEDPDGNSQAVSINLRYPGQLFDVESGMHYNYFRDYDPVTGRYPQSDPIGLVGGLITYNYVGGNPLTQIDPYGLTTVQVGLTLNFQIGPVNLNGTYGVVVDLHGNIGIYYAAGGGIGAGADAFGGVNVGISTGECIEDIGGPFFNESANLGAGIAGGLDTFVGQGSYGQPVDGGGFSVGYGAGAQYSVGGSQTVVRSLWRH